MTLYSHNPGKKLDLSQTHGKAFINLNRLNNGYMKRSIRAIALSITCTFGVSLIGCEKIKPEDNTVKVRILEDRVIVDKSLIVTNNPETYQPSYNLHGALVPSEEVKISSPYPADKVALFVKKGDWVEKEQIIAKLDTYIKNNDSVLSNDEFIDMQLLNKAGKPIRSSKLMSLTGNSETNSKADSKSNKEKSRTNVNGVNKRPEVLTKPYNEDDSLLTRLTFKSPIAGEVIDIKLGTNSTKLTTNKKVAELSNKNSLNQQNTTSNDKPSKSMGNIEHNKLDYKYASHIAANTTFITIANTRTLQLIGNLPLIAETKLAVGQPVNFTVDDTHAQFNGQVSHIIPQPIDNFVIVKATVIPDNENKALLEPGMQATMTIDYGNKEIGVRLPREAIREADLSQLSRKQPRPVSPIHGYVWVITQDQTLDYTEVEVVSYFPDSNQYLVNGIDNDSLVCLADLPADLDGKLISVD